MQIQIITLQQMDKAFALLIQQMKEEQQQQLQTRRPTKCRTTIDASPSSPSHSRLLRLPINTIQLPQNIQKSTRIHMSHQNLNTANKNSNYEMADKINVKPSRFKLEDYNYFKNEQQQQSRKQKKSSLFNIRTLNIYKKIKNDEKKDQFCSKLFRITAFTDFSQLPFPDQQKQNNHNSRILKKCQSLNSSLLETLPIPCQQKRSVRRLTRKMAYEFVMTQNGPS